MQVTLYTRPGCHLCDDARAVVLAEREQTPFSFEEVDIEGSDVLLAEYGIRIPVIVVDGEEAFEYTVEADAFAGIVRPRVGGL
ncbi:MAG: glutaredoxin family protein [Actinomycetota bacterium]|nr:glutaredoxin family protein [Actinomycetota bacterium]MDH5223317.1 glutaredoxin family protein [Actinomycetota bacterium]MDH5313924.1 glutaredoxin family protein [Actinomycetota bacterium]